MDFTMTVNFGPETLQRIDAFLTAINGSTPATKTVASPNKTVTAKPVETAEKTNGKATVITLEDLRKLSKDKSDQSKEMKGKVLKLVREYADSVSEIPEDKYTEYHNKLMAI